MVHSPPHGKHLAWDQMIKVAIMKHGFIWILLIGATLGPSKRCMSSAFLWQNDPRNAHTGIPKTYQQNHERPLALFVSMWLLTRGLLFSLCRSGHSTSESSLSSSLSDLMKHFASAWMDPCLFLACFFFPCNVSFSRHLVLITLHAAPCANVSCPKNEAVRWDYVSTSTPSAEQTHRWDTEKWSDTLGRSGDKPRMECCDDQNGTIMYKRAVQEHGHGAKINPTFFLFETCAADLTGTRIPHGQPFQLWINLTEWWMGRSMKFEKHKKSLSRVTSKSVRFVIKTADDQLGRTSSWIKNVLYKQSYRPDYDCISYFNLRRGKDAICPSK